MMNRRLLITQFSSTAVGRVCSALLQGLSYILLARSVEPEEFGFASGLIGVAMFAQTLFDLGLSTYVVRERSRCPGSGAVTAALRWNDRLSVLLCVVSGVVIVSLGVTVSPQFLLLVPLAAWMGSERNVTAWLSVAYADGDWRMNLGNLLVRRVLALVLFLALIAVDVPALLAFSLSWALSAAISSVHSKRFLVSRLPPTSEIGLRELFSETKSYWHHSVATQAKNLDVSLAGIFAGPVDAGLFATASRMTSPLRLLPTSLATALIPASSRATNHSERERLNKLVLLALIAMALIYSLLYFLLPWAVPEFLGEAYVPATLLLQIVVAGLPFAAGASMVGAILQGIGEKQYVARVSVLVTSIYLIQMTLSVYVFGSVGATWALFTSFALQFFLCSGRLYRVQRSARMVQRTTLGPHASGTGDT